jgi:hypothetical protein
VRIPDVSSHFPYGICQLRTTHPILVNRYQQADHHELDRGNLSRVFEHFIQLIVQNEPREYAKCVLYLPAEGRRELNVLGEPSFELDNGAGGLEGSPVRFHAVDRLRKASEVPSAAPVPFECFTGKGALFFEVFGLQLADKGSAGSIDNL